MEISSARKDYVNFMRLIDADFEVAHWESVLLEPTPDVTEKDRRTAPYIIDALKMAGTVKDAVEVVRCKDCRHCVGNRCRRNASLNDWRRDDDFCSFGERKADV